MPDPIVTGAIKAGKALEKAAEDAPGPPVASSELESGELTNETLDYLTRASGGPIGELWAMPGDWIRFRRWKRAIARAEEARRILAERGREPRQVDDSTLVPLIDAANLTDDENLSAKWAALLANATDPEMDEVPPAHAEILRQLSRDDAILLDSVVERVAARATRVVPITSMSLSVPILQRGPINDPERFRIALDNLLRLRILVEVVEQSRTARNSTGGVRRSQDLKTTLRISALGAAFVRAVNSEPDSTTP